ncbi:MAG: response regulator [Planctomycetota bacterium]
MSVKTIEILLAEDSATDAELTMEALAGGRVKNRITHVHHGEEAMEYLLGEGRYVGRTRPDLVLLDLNMPRMDGREVLRAMREHDRLKVIPVVVLTTSTHDQDVLESYGLSANAYIVKPVGLHQFFEVIQQIQDFWLQIVKLPPQ